jgi:predicted aspartyl protease
MRHVRSGFVMLVSLSGGIGAGTEHVAGAAHGSLARLTAFDERGGVIVPVTIDGAGPFMFMFDTGSTRTAIADDLVAQLPAPVVARAEVVSSAGPEMHDIARIERVEVAGARAPVLLASIVPAARLRAIGSELRGVLGQDFLSGFNYTLDYRRGRLTWDTIAASCESRGAVPLVSAEGRFVVHATEERSSRSLRLVPDTGADSLVLFAPIGIDESANVRDAVAVTSATGSTRGRTMPAPGLVVGAVTLRNRSAVVVERDAADSDGLLPLHIFASVSFNMRDGCIIVRGR